MCDCDNNKNVVDLPHLKIYTNMATYKSKKTFKRELLVLFMEAIM